MDFEFLPVFKEKKFFEAFDTSFIDKIVSLLQYPKSLIANQLVRIKNSLSEINCNVLYGNDYAFRCFIKWVHLPIKINSSVMSLPVILIFEENFNANPNDICRLHQIEPSDIIILVIQGRHDIRPQVLQLKKIYKDIPVFSLTGIDDSEIVPISLFYNSYKEKALRKFILSCPDETWKDPLAVKLMIDAL